MHRCSRVCARYYPDVISTCGNVAFDEVMRTFALCLARVGRATTGSCAEGPRYSLSGREEILEHLPTGCPADAQHVRQPRLEAAWAVIVVAGLLPAAPPMGGELR